MLRLKEMCARARRRRINRLLIELEGYERSMRDRCHQLIELTDHGDDVHLAALLVLEALDAQP